MSGPADVPSSIAASELLSRIHAGNAPVILDVRSRHEYATGHVPGAVHIPFWAMAGRIADVPAERADPVVIYCGHGPRAVIAAMFLRAAGFTRLITLEGHMSRWAREGLPQDAGSE